MNVRRFFWAAVIFFLMVLPAAASDVTPSYLYRNQRDPEIPKMLPTGWIAECGNFSIRLLQDPVVVKSNNYLISPSDTKYLMVRAEVTNKGTESDGWLSPASFSIQDTYMGRIYGTYRMNITVSARASAVSNEDAFFSEIKPGESIKMTLAFSVYPDVEDWIFTFAPQHFGDEVPEQVVRFRLPPAEFIE